MSHFNAPSDRQNRVANNTSTSHRTGISADSEETSTSARSAHTDVIVNTGHWVPTLNHWNDTDRSSNGTDIHKDDNAAPGAICNIRAVLCTCTLCRHCNQGL